MKRFKKFATISMTLLGGLLISAKLSATPVAADSDNTQPQGQDSTNQPANAAPANKTGDSGKTDANKPGATDNEAADNGGQDDASDQPMPKKKKPKQVVTGYAMMTKVAGNKNYK
ncbi:hypothetical protein EQ500_16135, partial [Lactobacillus sp. XV13L]|nr:hypothetical protein [Lactobacillus sp. XV13L]